MPRGFYIPSNYRPSLTINQTEKAIKQIKDFFQLNLSLELNLERLTAPLFVLKGTGINDDLNGTERPVTFKIKGLHETEAEIVHSLAKWKRMALAHHQIPCGAGIYTDMNAIRADEELDNIHSLYVDQWDWEKVFTANERTIPFLKLTVKKIYEAIKRTELFIAREHPQITPFLPENITFFHAEELLTKYPALSPQEREDKIAKEYGAVFIIGIGGVLSNGQSHDGRAPDYDDWSTINDNGYPGLNGDIIVWNPLLDMAFELSSMGIRVDKVALARQLKIRNQEDKMNCLFHKKLLNDELPLSIGGGIGQSRLCMFYLQKAHIGEIQASIWPDDMNKKCAKNNIILL